MKYYNIGNYIRYKQELDFKLKNLEKKEYVDYTRDELILLFMPVSLKYPSSFSSESFGDPISDVISFLSLCLSSHDCFVESSKQLVWELSLSSST